MTERWRRSQEAAVCSPGRMRAPAAAVMEVARRRAPEETHFLAQIEEHRGNSEKTTLSGHGPQYITSSTPPFASTGGTEKLPSPGNRRHPVASGALREHPVWPSSLALAVLRLRGRWIAVESVWGEVGGFCAAVGSVPSWPATDLAPCLHPHQQRRYATQPRYTWTGAQVRCQYRLKNGAPSQKVLRSLCFLSHPPTPTPAQHL